MGILKTVSVSLCGRGEALRLTHVWRPSLTEAARYLRCQLYRTTRENTDLHQSSTRQRSCQTASGRRMRDANDCTEATQTNVKLTSHQHTWYANDWTEATQTTVKLTSHQHTWYANDWTEATQTTVKLTSHQLTSTQPQTTSHQHTWYAKDDVKQRKTHHASKVLCTSS
jgi:hypothetical protein